ncbi:hypothetical protein [Streptomyces sp. NPDC050388]|uniref:hypothetical protein n=1 Tax=Streptomyces sp. NPDC050388 TaxID=3155781 RepID=UPI00341D442E
MAKALESAPGGRIDVGGCIVSADLDIAAHDLACTGSGGGSSTVLRTLTAQLLHHSAYALVLNAERISYQWTKGLLTVTYRADVTDIHAALVGLAAELQRRIDHCDQYGDPEDLPRLSVVSEGASVPMRRQLFERHTLHGEYLPAAVTPADRPAQPLVDLRGRRPKAATGPRAAPTAHPRRDDGDHEFGPGREYERFTHGLH